MDLRLICALQLLWRHVLVGLSKISLSMCVCAVFPKAAHLFLLEILTFLGFIVVVRDVHKLILHFNR